MKLLSLARILIAAALFASAALTPACSSGNSSDGSGDDGSGADDGAAAAPPTVRIVRPTPNQEFKSTDKITFEGTGIDAVDGDIARAVDAKQRMLWGISKPDQGSINPAGEGPSDSIGAGTDHPTVPGTFIVHFDVTNTRGSTGSATVTIVIK